MVDTARKKQLAKPLRLCRSFMQVISPHFGYENCSAITHLGAVDGGS